MLRAMRTPSLLAVILATTVAACASSNGGAAPDSDLTPVIDSGGDDSGGGDGGGSDGALAPDSSTAIDGATIDGMPIDGSMIDGMPIDAMPIDAMPIDGSTCPTTPCDLHAQCGCGAGQACDIDFSDLDGTACRGVATAGDENDTCTAINQCAVGHVCLGDGTNSSCAEYCDADADCNAPRGQCVIQLNNASSQPIPGAVVCSSNCNPATTANPLCPTGWTCDLFSATFGGTDHDIVDCRVTGARQLDQTCSATMACAAGLTCTNTGTSSICLKVCTRPAGTECATVSGSTCTSFNPTFVVGGSEYGVCF